MTTTTPIIPKLKLSSIIEEIQDAILLKLFGSEYINVKTLLSTMTQVIKSDGYELELRFINDKGHTSIPLWQTFLSNTSLELIEYEDDIIYTYQPSLPINNVHVRSYQKSNMYERKMLINSITSRTEDKTVIPLKINLSKESTVSPAKELMNYDNIQRRQRCSYKFNTSNSSTISYLSNWRVDKTIRLFASSIHDKKLSVELNISNLETLTYYDALDIEFEYIGSYSEIQPSFFELIRTIYSAYELFDIEYLIIKQALSTVIPPSAFANKNILSCLPQPSMMTNDILQTVSIRDFMITNKYTGFHSLIIVFGDESNYIIYELNDKSLNKVAGTLNIINIGKDNSTNQSTIDSIINSFNENKHIDYLPQINAFESMTTHDNKFILTDTLIYNNELVQSKPLIKRREYIDNFINTFQLPDNRFSLASIVKANSWSDILEKKNKPYICKPLNESLFDSKIYKITFHEQITINFKVMYVPIKRLFYLYVIGDLNQVIESKTINNKYSTSHFGYSPLTLYNTSIAETNNIYLLYVSPYIKESYVLKPMITDTNELMKQMYMEPMKFNNTVIKMTRIDDSNTTWIPLSVCSTDTPDTYINALKLESLIFDHLRISNYNPNNNHNIHD